MLGGGRAGQARRKATVPCKLRIRNAIQLPKKPSKAAPCLPSLPLPALRCIEGSTGHTPSCRCARVRTARLGTLAGLAFLEEHVCRLLAHAEPQHHLFRLHAALACSHALALAGTSDQRAESALAVALHYHGIGSRHRLSPATHGCAKRSAAGIITAAACARACARSLDTCS